MTIEQLLNNLGCSTSFLTAKISANGKYFDSISNTSAQHMLSFIAASHLNKFYISPNTEEDMVIYDFNGKQLQDALFRFADSKLTQDSLMLFLSGKIVFAIQSERDVRTLNHLITKLEIDTPSLFFNNDIGNFVHFIYNLRTITKEEVRTFRIKNTLFIYDNTLK